MTVEHEHPTASQAELLAGAGVAVDRVHDPQAEHDERQADDPAHDRVEPIRQQRTEQQGREAEHDDDGTVAQRVQRPEPDGVGLAGEEPRPADGRSDGEARREGRAAGPGIVRSNLSIAAVGVACPGIVEMLVLVGRLGHAGGGGRARDVGDRRDVVPVDPVSDAQQQAGEQDAEVGGGAVPPRWRR